jgi:spore coat protein U-like protein
MIVVALGAAAIMVARFPHCLSETGYRAAEQRKFTMRLWPLALFAAPLPLQSAIAAEGTRTLPVSARILQGCDIGGSESGALPRGVIDFGARTFAKSATMLIAGTLPIRCNTGLSPEVTLDSGQNAVGTQRNLRGPGGVLIAYDLLRGESLDAPPWDTDGYSVPLDGAEVQSVKIAGRISLPTEAIADGTYTDTILVRIDY